MFKIGEFSSLSRVSIRMLRHYDELGLLKPVQIDPNTGFRYYLAEQLPRLNRIIAFKNLGFSLQQIASLLDANLSAHQIRAILNQKHSELEQRLALEQQRLRAVELRLNQIEQAETLPEWEVILRPELPQLVASIRQGVSRPDQIESWFDEVETFAHSQGARLASPPLLIHHRFKVELEVAVPLARLLAATGRIRVYELPHYEWVACLVHTGPYHLLDKAKISLLNWAQAHHYQVAGPLREVFLRFSAQMQGYKIPKAYLTEQACQFVTELQLPLAKTG